MLHHNRMLRGRKHPRFAIGSFDDGPPSISQLTRVLQMCATTYHCTDLNQMDGAIQFYNRDGSATCPQYPDDVGCCYNYS
jgi:hypothetical protein